MDVIDKYKELRKIVKSNKQQIVGLALRNVRQDKDIRIQDINDIGLSGNLWKALEKGVFLDGLNNLDLIDKLFKHYGITIEDFRKEVKYINDFLNNEKAMRMIKTYDEVTVKIGGSSGDTLILSNALRSRNKVLDRFIDKDSLEEN